MFKKCLSAAGVVHTRHKQKRHSMTVPFLQSLRTVHSFPHSLNKVFVPRRHYGLMMGVKFVRINSLL